MGYKIIAIAFICICVVMLVIIIQMNYLIQDVRKLEIEFTKLMLHIRATDKRVDFLTYCKETANDPDIPCTEEELHNDLQ